MAVSPPVVPTLSRSLRSRHVALISLGGIIGAGLFVGSSANIATVGPAVLVSYAIAGALMFLVMRMLAEMAAADPHALSFADHARAGLGAWAGFVCGWLYWYFWVVVVGIEAIAGALILQIWVPLPVWQIGLALMVLLTATNLLSTRSYGEFEFWFASIKVAAIVAFIVVAGSYALGLTSPTGSTLSNLVAHGGFAPFGAAAVLAGVTGIVFSMTGAEIATVVVAVSSEPSRAIAALTTALILRILLFYVGSVLCILAVVPWPEIVPGSSPFVAALERMDVPFAATIMNVIVLVAVLSCLNSGLYVTSRMLFGLAAHGDAPRALVALDSRGVPTRAILLVIYLLVALAQIRRRRVFERDGERLAIRMWLFPWLSYATVIGIALVLLSMLFRDAERVQFAASALSLAVVLAALWWRRRRSR